MSDEAHIEAAHARHMSLVAPRPWEPRGPDEELMAREEGETDETPKGAWLMETLLVYLFADAAPLVFGNVALRALAVMNHCLPAMRVSRPNDRAATLFIGTTGYSLSDFKRLCEAEASRVLLEQLMEFLFPAGGDWLRRGCMRVYLVARAYNPALVTVEGRELSYEDFAKIFGEGPLVTKRERNKARSRWSARAQEVLRKPIERAGGRGQVAFGKSSHARAKSAASAKGNQNRKGTAKLKGTGLKARKFIQD